MLVLLGSMTIFFYFLLIIFLVMIASIIITYTFESMALVRIGKNLGYSKPATAWIPFYNKYILGRVAGNKPLGMILVIVDISIVISFVCYITIVTYHEIFFDTFLLSVLISFIMNTILSHKIYAKLAGKRVDIYTVLGVITFGFLRPIFLFVIRNKKESEEIESSL